ncbi:Scr1 family TA system antitoxin-like transcriptional regulator [Phytohabitans kaempferiae]|uniref:Scr1 family TA system antitoxin-like transcriptional regulator n=1 Tax=Phytohabitans kaempferiae TaxID=1620943 RepID=A0ABV6M825_9ACTN
MTVPNKKEQRAPSLRACLLGDRLRALREDRGLTLRYVSAYLGVDYNLVRLLEHGEWRSHRGEVVTLLDLYGVHEHGERDFLVGLARDAFRLPLWEGDFDAPELDVSTLDSLWLESVAEQIRCYGAALVPDLLRTPGYAEAVVRRKHGPHASEQELVWRTRASSRRQRGVFDRRPLVDVRAVIAEAALHRPVGATEDTWRAQLEQLSKGGEHGSVQVRVLPTSASYVPGMDGTFTVFDLAQSFVPAVACRPHAHSVAVHDGRTTEWYARAFDQLWDAALPAAESARLIGDLVAETTARR